MIRPPQPLSLPKLPFIVFCFLWTLFFCWHFNTDWQQWTTWERVQKMNDVQAIMVGYHQVPSLWIGGLRWWHGPWIENGIHVFRPLASYLLWGECWLGLRFGFGIVAWIGLGLLVALGCACAALTWRLTRSPILTLLSSLLAATTKFHVMGGSMPSYWLAWFPVHHDILFILAIVSALFWLDLWLETKKPWYLGATWLCFVLGALTKEYAYLFPLLAALWVWGRAGDEIKRAAWRQVIFFFSLAVALFAYRALILTDPYNPPRLKKVHFLRKPWMYWFPGFYRYIPGNVLWLPGLALVLYLVGAYWRALLNHAKAKEILQRPGAVPVGLMLSIFVIGVYLWLSAGSIFEAFWRLFDPAVFRISMGDLSYMTFSIYVVALIWRKRQQQLGVLALGMLILIYLPVFTYLGWHYGLAGWFVRASIWWPVVVYMVAHDLGLERALLVQKTKG